MQKKYKKLGLILVIAIIVIIVVKSIANIVIERKIISYLKDLPENIKVEYTTIDASIISGDVNLFSPHLRISGKTSRDTIIDANLKTLKVKGLSYWDYLVNDKITIDKFLIDELALNYLHNASIKKDSYNKSMLERLKRDVSIAKVAITNTELTVINIQTDSTLFRTEKLNFEVTSLNLKSSAQQGEETLEFENFNLKSVNLKYSLNPYDDFFIDNLNFNEDKLTLSNVSLKTKYTEQQLSALLKEERDHFNANFQSIEFITPKLIFESGSRPWFKSSKVILYSPEAEIYRDKLVADDLTPKPLYGKMLRDLKFNLSINAIDLKDGKLKYSEKVKEDTKAGVIDFDNFNATVTNFGNTYNPSEETKITVNTLFMKETPLKVNWSFRVKDSTDQFVFKADLGAMDVSEINQFTEPNLNVRFSGILNQTYYTISGNPTASNIDLKVKYDNLDISVLKEDGKERNRFLSGLISIFVADTSKDEPNDYRFGASENVERDVTKSVFNFVWKNLQSGLRSAIAGDGEKED